MCASGFMTYLCAPLLNAVWRTSGLPCVVGNTTRTPETAGGQSRSPGCGGADSQNLADCGDHGSDKNLEYYSVGKAGDGLESIRPRPQVDRWHPPGLAA